MELSLFVWAFNSGKDVDGGWRIGEATGSGEAAGVFATLASLRKLRRHCKASLLWNSRNFVVVVESSKLILYFVFEH